MEQTRKIFLIDDEHLNNFINTKMITRFLPHEVTAFTRANEALEFLKTSQDPALLTEVIFLDLNMPEMDGWQFLQAYEQLGDKIHRHCNVVVLSSSIDMRDIERARSIKVVREFISKPLSMENLRFITECGILKSA